MAKRSATPKRNSPAESTAVATIETAAPALGAEGSSQLCTEGFCVISIGEKKFELRGVVGDHIKVKYHVSFEKAELLGTIPEIAKGVGKALGIPNASGFADDLNAMLENLRKVPLFGPIANILETGQVSVTDLGIDTQAGKYQFGFGWDLTKTDPRTEMGGIAMDAFGLLFTYTTPKTK